MKKVMFTLIVSAIAMSGIAQNNKAVIGGYGAGFAELAWVGGKAGLNLGGYGGVLINHKLLLGVAGNNIFFKQSLAGKKQDFQFNYYGLYTEYKIAPEKNVHLTAALTGAMGWLENDLAGSKKSGKRDGDFTYVIQPKMAVNVKVTSFMQVQAYGTYRFTGNTNSEFYTRKNLNGFSSGVALVFGGF